MAGTPEAAPDLDLPVPQPLPPMEAVTADAIPVGEQLQFEPKWDGFRCIAYRDGATVELQSKAMKSLTRYFPEMVETLKALRPRRFVLDGELVVPVEGKLDFDALLQRIHPVESRVRRLAAETPSMLVVFDLLATGAKTSLLDLPMAERRSRLEDWSARYLGDAERVHLSPATTDRDEAEGWLARLKGVDGVMVKDRTATYRSGERDGMVKVKRYRTADCAVGGFREASDGDAVGSLLLGLYGEDGLLHHVGYTSSLGAGQREELLQRLRPLIEPPGFTGRSPGGPSRWDREGRSSAFHPLRPELVVEVRYDHFSGDRFRHGTRFERWRPDKAAEQCTFGQVRVKGPGVLALVGVG